MKEDQRYVFRIHHSAFSQAIDLKLFNRNCIVLGQFCSFISRLNISQRHLSF